ncbi:MAG: DUF2203 domain-containing protein [Pirellulaceae bacterium]|jgi:hypothetical protein|nr:DUF2203 domain-containing protein [Pirellulaceae bacterium]
MMVQTYKPTRMFTVREANAMLPLVRAITRDLVLLSREVVERHQRVEHLKAGRSITAGDPYQDELAQIEDELSKDRERLHEYVNELRQLGVEPKSGVDGIVDFPARLNDELVYLCWKFGEPEVQYWHTLDSGFAARRPLTAEMTTGISAAESN